MLRILVATTNPHKVSEIQAIAAAGGGAGVRFLSLAEVPGGDSIPEPVEDGATFAANARLKARHYAEAAGLPTLADDSGLCVDALGGAPGVHSARYSGLAGPRSVVDPANNRKLMAALAGVPVGRRGAAFVCAMALWLPGERAPLAEAEGRFAGRILLPEECADPAAPERGRGAHGFGYDPLLWLADAGCTSAELDPAAKNARSHRGQATRALLGRLPALHGRLSALR